MEFRGDIKPFTANLRVNSNFNGNNSEKYKRCRFCGRMAIFAPLYNKDQSISEEREVCTLCQQKQRKKIKLFN